MKDTNTFSIPPLSLIWVTACLVDGPFFNGIQTGQSVRIQNFQWEMIWCDDAQWSTKTIGSTNYLFAEAGWNLLNINWNYIL